MKSNINSVIKKYLSEIIATCAMLIALVATTASIIQTIDNKKHNKLSVKPHLYISTKSSNINIDNSYTFNVHLKNSGAGPAFISNISYIFNEKLLSSSGSELEGEIINFFQERLSKSKVNYAFNYSVSISEINDSSLREGEEFNIIQIYISPKATNSKQNIKEDFVKVYNELPYYFLNRFKLIVEFTSLYEESFTFKTGFK